MATHGRKPRFTRSALTQHMPGIRPNQPKVLIAVLAALGCMTLLVLAQGLGDFAAREQPRGHDLRLVVTHAAATDHDATPAIESQVRPEPVRMPLDDEDHGGRVPPSATDVISLIPSTPSAQGEPPAETESAPVRAVVATPQATPTPTPTTAIVPMRMRNTMRPPRSLTPTATTKPPRSLTATATPTPTPTPTPTLSPTPQSDPEPKHDQCYDERDLGIIEQAATRSTVFCAGNGSRLWNRSTDAQQTQITLVDAPAGLRAVVFRSLVLNLASATAHGPIQSLAQDGGSHDPRFRFMPTMVHCSCDAFHSFMTSNVSDTRAKWNVWDIALAFQAEWHKLDDSLSCAHREEATKSVGSDSSNSTETTFTGRVLLLPRRDDHNPFFQVSYALNAWIMMRVFRWDPSNVTLIHLDDGYPSPVDELHEKLLSPSNPLLRGKDLIGKQLRFADEVMLAPFEAVGPMMQHLDDAEPCFASELFHTFRNASLTALGAVAPSVRDRIVVTLISRKPISGRRVQRRWLNEDDVLERLRGQYRWLAGKPVVFQSIDFAGLPLQRQMQLMLESDVVVGMHGAGMVNVMWTRSGTLVLEIFPVRRKRWGFRNLCQHLGCNWHEFRGGRDTGMGDNASNKFISYEDWRAFFDPLFQSHVANITAGTR